MGWSVPCESSNPSKPRGPIKSSAPFSLGALREDGESRELIDLLKLDSLDLTS